MTVDVVIPLFNGGSWIEEALESVFAQTADLGDVVVVDDGSSDDGPERVASFGDKVRLLANRGRRHARHAGLLETKGDLVAFLDQDDVWHPEHLALLSAVLVDFPAACAAAAGTTTFHDGERPGHQLLHGAPEVLDPWAVWPFRCPIRTPSAVLLRRAPLVASGGWAAGAVSDWELYLRLGASQPLVLSPPATCAYRLHAEAQSSQLRRDGLCFLELTSRCVEASLAYRLAQGEDAATRETLERQHEIFAAFAALLRAVSANDGTEPASAAHALEQRLAGEDDAYLLRMAEFAIYLFCPDEDGPEYPGRRGAFLDEIEARLPPDVPRVRRAFVVLARHRPFRWRRLMRYLLKGRWPSAHALLAQRREEIAGASLVKR